MPSAKRVVSSSAGPQAPWIKLALGFTACFMALHVYWAIGGTWGLPPAALHTEHLVKAANWVVCGIMLVGMAFIFALGHPIGRRIPTWLLLVPLWVGAVVCVSHSLYGVSTKALYLAGVSGASHFPVVPGVNATTAAASNHLAAIRDLTIFEPCFLLQGVLLTLAVGQFLSEPTNRRRWILTIVVGTVAIDILGAILTLGNWHIAIS